MGKVRDIKSAHPGYYYIYLTCANCYNQRQLAITKGKRVMDVTGSQACPMCRCIGMEVVDHERMIAERKEEECGNGEEVDECGVLKS